jgi:hypothetical protein
MMVGVLVLPDVNDAQAGEPVHPQPRIYHCRGRVRPHAAAAHRMKAGAGTRAKILQQSRLAGVGRARLEGRCDDLAERRGGRDGAQQAHPGDGLGDVVLGREVVGEDQRRGERIGAADLDAAAC